MRLAILLLSLIAVFSCKNDGNDFVDLDLMSKGLPIKIKAPVDAVVTASDMGVMQDITVQKGDNFNLQILASNAVSINQKALLLEQKAAVEKGPFFSKIVSENESGFIFEKKIDETINYDFRVVKIQGDKEYIFQTALIGKFTQEDVQSMFDCVSKKS